MSSEKIIAACGNDCAACPRFLPKSEDELHKTAILWYKIGCRDNVVSNDEISCNGCKKENWCRYGIISCTSEKIYITAANATYILAVRLMRLLKKLWNLSLYAEKFVPMRNIL